MIYLPNHTSIVLEMDSHTLKLFSYIYYTNTIEEENVKYSNRKFRFKKSHLTWDFNFY